LFPADSQDKLILLLIIGQLNLPEIEDCALLPSAFNYVSDFALRARLMAGAIGAEGKGSED